MYPPFVTNFSSDSVMVEIWDSIGHLLNQSLDLIIIIIKGIPPTLPNICLF